MSFTKWNYCQYSLSSQVIERRTKLLRKVLWGMTAGVVLALVPGMAMAQSSAAQPVDPPQQVAELRQQFEGLTAEEIKGQGYMPMHGCISNPQGPGAMGTHAVNQELLEAQFPKGEMDPAQPSVLLLDQNNEVIGVEWEAADIGQGPMELFGQTIQIQPGHPGAEEPHYMLHVYFKPDGKVLFGTDPQTAFDPDLSCPEMPETGGMVLSSVQLGGLFALAGGLALLGAAFVVRRRLS